MTVCQTYESELNNLGRIVLYREGLFWKAYERSAFLVLRRGAAYQVNWTCSKDCPEGVVSVGFPDGGLAALRTSLPLIDESPSRVVLDSGMTVTEAAFLQWKAERINEARSRRLGRRVKRSIRENPALHAALEAAARKDGVLERQQEQQCRRDMERTRVLKDEAEYIRWSKDLLGRILRFDLASSTMMESVVFLSKVQSEIQGHGEEKEHAVVR